MYVGRWVTYLLVTPSMGRGSRQVVEEEEDDDDDEDGEDDPPLEMEMSGERC